MDQNANSSLTKADLLRIDRNIKFIPDFYYDYSDNYLYSMKLAISKVSIQEKVNFVFIITRII